MTRLDALERMRNEVSRFGSDQALINSWAQIRSKHILASIAPASVDTINYTYSTRQMVRRTTSILQRAMRLEEAGALDASTSDSLLKAAEVFEYLANLGEGSSYEDSILLSAGLFQLAGYAANSICISRGINSSPISNDLTHDTSRRLLDRGLELVLKRRFVRLLREARNVSNQFGNSEDAFLELLKTEDAPPEAAIAFPATLWAATALHQLSAHALGGASIAPFFETTKNLHDLFLASGDAESLLKADLLSSIGNRIAITSVWTELAGRITEDGVWRRYALLSSRGRSTNTLDARSGTELWQSQLEALKAGLLSNGNKGLAVRMPTSAGKTRIAEMAILDALTGLRRQVVYVAPFNALADEIEVSMSSLFSDLGFRVSSILGSYELDELEEDLLTSSDLLITTPEKLTLLLRHRPESL